MSQGSTSVGRQGSTGTFTNTVAPKSAEQAMLMKMDEMIAKQNEIIAKLAEVFTAIAGSTDGDSLQTALAALVAPSATALEAVKLVR